MLKLASSVLTAAMVAACASPPETYSFENTKTYARPYDDVWNDLIDFFSMGNIQIKTIEKDSGILYAESSAFPTTYADCGDPGFQTTVQTVGQFNVFVRPLRQNRTQLTVNTDYRALRQFAGYPPSSVVCISTGLLETSILERIASQESATSSFVQDTRAPAADVPSQAAPAPRSPAAPSPTSLDPGSTRAGVATSTYVPKGSIVPMGPSIAPESGGCSIKGNIERDGSRLFYAPGHRWYDLTSVDPARGEGWFCSEQDANAAGWQRAPE